MTLTLVASCTAPTVVTVPRISPATSGPDDVTINCTPPTPTPTPTSTPTVTPTPPPSATPAPTSTPVPPQPTALTSSVLGVVTPPNTGDAGLK